MKLIITTYRRYQWLLGVTKQNLLYFVGTETISMELLFVYNSNQDSRLKIQNHLFDLHKVQGYKVKETPIKIK